MAASPSSRSLARTRSTFEAQGDFCSLSVRVKCVTRLGQAVAISGSCFPVTQLYTTPESYPIWYSLNPITVPRRETITYNYCVTEGGKVKGAEESLTPRRVTLDAPLTLEDEFNLDNVAKEVDVINSSKGLNSHTSEGDLDWLNIGERHCRLFLVCYHLPVEIRRTGDPDRPFEVTWSDSLISRSADSSVSMSLQTTWIGTVSVAESELAPAERAFLLQTLEDMHCIPVFLDADVAADAYFGFCKTVMWPVFHNVDQLDHIHAAWNLPADSQPLSPNPNPNPSPLGGGNPNRSRAGSRVFDNAENKVLEWNKHTSRFRDAFHRVNEVFAKTIARCAREGDIIWVHDYHLMLVPLLLRGTPEGVGSSLKIIFFLHIPFPTSQIFRTLPEAPLLLRSMAAADLVGFHAFDHARHFLNASRRMLGFLTQTRPGGMITLAVGDREVIVTMSHVSIETSRFDGLLVDEEVLAMAEEVRRRHAGRRIVLGMDVCQRLAGTALKLAAFEKYLADHTNASKEVPVQVVLIQKSIRQGSRLEDEETTSQDLRAMARSINQKYALRGNTAEVVAYEEVADAAMGLKQRVALYLAADVFLITPIREGLNLLPLEYIYCKRDAPRAGVVVASEFSTCSSLLNGSIKVNPFAPSAVADALDKALGLSRTDCAYRSQRDLPFIVSHPSSLWTKRILCELEQLQTGSGRGRAKAVKLPDELDPAALLRAYRSTSCTSSGAQRLFVLEYTGVLVAKESSDIYMKQSKTMGDRLPSQRMLSAVRRLSEDKRNVVVVLTGLTAQKLHAFDAMPAVTIATSHGLLYSFGTPEEAPGGRAWEALSCAVDWDAVKAAALPIISRFTFRTNGSCASPRTPGVGWSYFGADPEWGAKQAKQLALELEAALVRYDVKIVSLIPGSIEVVPAVLHKGLFVRSVLQRMAAPPALVTVLSDDGDSDGMLEAVFQEVPGGGAGGAAKVFTVTVGRKETPCQYYLNDVPDVEELLQALVGDEADDGLHDGEQKER